MTGHECEHAIDAGAYLLSALPDEDHVLYAEHLRTCRSCRHEVERLQIVVDTLPNAAPQLTPPTDLKDRIMRVVDAEAGLLRAAGPDADRVPVAAPRERRRWGSMLSLRPALAGGLASVLIAVGVAGGVLLSGDDVAPTRTLSAKVTAPGAPDALAKVSLQRNHATLHVQRLPDAPSGRVYQVWFVKKGSAVAVPTHTLFSVRSNDGRSTIPIEESVAGVDRILVTAEPGGGSSHPTGDPLIDAALS